MSERCPPGFQLEPNESGWWAVKTDAERICEPIMPTAEYFENLYEDEVDKADQMC